MKSIAIAALLGQISAQELLVDSLLIVPAPVEDDTLFNPHEDTLEELNKPEPTDPCCGTCSEPLEKYYSIDKLHGNCGEACMDPKQFWLYKIFEPALTKDDSTNTPCSDRGFDDYQYTPTHGFGPVKMTLDLYGPHKNEGELHDTEEDCNKLSADDSCHSDKKCSWCKSAAVKSSCHSIENAKALPAAVFQCDNLSTDFILPTTTCDDECKQTCCLNGGGDACTSACGCTSCDTMLEDVAEDCEKLSSSDSCDGNDECSWCKSGAVPPACHSLEDAKKLPSAVFQCDKLNSIF
jgi:hypothetical protein